MAIILKIISLDVNVPVLSVRMMSTEPSSSTIEVLSTAHSLLDYLSISLLSAARNSPENVLMPSISMLRVIGIRKLSSRKMVSIVREAIY
jgi:hypothetical protein